MSDQKSELKPFSHLEKPVCSHELGSLFLTLCISLSKFVQLILFSITEKVRVQDICAIKLDLLDPDQSRGEGPKLLPRKQACVMAANSLEL